MTRISQRDLLPTSVKSRSLGNVIHLTETVSASTTLSAGEDVLFTLLLINQKDADIIADPEWSLWETSISAANLIPNGSSVDMDDYQIIGPWNEWVESVYLSGQFETPIPSFATASRLYLRNISSGSRTIVVRARTRYLTNADQVTAS